MKKLGRLIESISELLINLAQVDLYLNDDVNGSKTQMCKLIANGRIFVVYMSGGEVRFAPSRFIGYLNNDLLTHLVKNNGKDGRDTTPVISKIIGGYGYNEDAEMQYIKFCANLGIKPANIKRKYWILDKEQNDQYINEYYEGNVQQVLVNRYERNPQARRECIEKFGCKCQICGMDFEKKYGEIGKGFIHIHHITPVSENKGYMYKIDPEKNLIPVCPNCHAMLHKSNLSIDDLKEIVNNK